MATIYRRNRGFSPTTSDEALGAEPAAGGGGWWGGWGQRRRPRARTALGDASPLSVRNPVINGVVGAGGAPLGAAHSGRCLVGQRAAQILWVAVLVYAFLGLPVFGRVLNLVRFAHRASLASVLKGLGAGLAQDLAVFCQASTLICVVKLLFHESSLLGSGGAGSAMPLGERAGSWLRTNDSGATTGLGRSLRIPVYMPVLTSEYETNAGDDASSTGTTAAAADSFGKHTTLLASSVVSGPTSSYLSSLAPRGSWFCAKVRRAAQTTVTVVLIKAVVVAATIASVVDFCLQVTMHPRLNRAFVEIFFNYAAQFAASLGDEEVVTRTVVCSWAVYLALVAALTYGFYANKFPLLPSFLGFFSGPSFFSSCLACDRHLHQGKRKDSMLSSTAASAATAEAPRSYIAALMPFNWFAAKQPPLPQQRPRRRSGQNHNLFPSQQPSPLFANLFGCGSSSASSFSVASTKPSPSTVVLRCFVVSVVVTVAALAASLLVDGKGVDMKLMSNAMFSLQTEGFFIKTNSINREEINCTLASQELLATLGASEVYETANLGNDDRCALLWRKTVGYTGDTFFDITLKNTTQTAVGAGEESIPAPVVVVGDGVEGSTPETEELAVLTDGNGGENHTDVTSEPTDDTKETVATSSTASTASPSEAPATKAVMPNIIVINMESWRALDVGVLGGAARKAKFGKSATPEFDELAKTGILYRKHFTQCVQTTRTLLTTLFGMLPSCTETTALKRYATSLNLRGLPQFLKTRGYFNMFWSAVNLSWEYWDKFLLHNGFDKLVDDRKIRKMLHEVRNYKNREDDHFSWGIHDHLSFEMLLHAIEASHNATRDAALKKANSTGSTSIVGKEGSATVMPSDATAASLRLNETVTAAPTKEEATAFKSMLRSRGNKNHEAKETEAQKKKKKKEAEEALAAAKFQVGWEGLREPYFIDMYSISSHNPWALPLDYEVPDLTTLYTAYTKKYIDAMYFSDEMLGKFVRGLRAKGLMKNTVVIVQGDHGYGRMEHNNPSIADSGIYDEGAHIPFLILADDFFSDKEKGMEVSQLTMQSDLMATIADILGVSPEEPLYQHGYGHSMRRRRPAVRPEDLIDVPIAAEEDGTPVSAATKSVLQERRVLLCNPFNGMTKGVRTEERKYAFFPDSSFKVFEQARDPGEKNPVLAGFDVEKMDVEIKTMFDFANEHVELNQFLFEANKFSAPLPPKSTADARTRQHVKRMPIQLEHQPFFVGKVGAATSNPAADTEAQAAEDSSSTLGGEAAAIATPHSAPAVIPTDSR